MLALVAANATIVRTKIERRTCFINLLLNLLLGSTVLLGDPGGSVLTPCYQPRRSATHSPEHSFFPVRHRPRPAWPLNRPEPAAYWSPRETTTLIAPFDATVPLA